MNRKNILLLLLLPFIVNLNLNGFSFGEVNFYVTNEFLFNYNDTADMEEQFYESLSILSSYKKWSLNFTLRSYNFFVQEPNTTLEKPNFDMYRKFIQFSSKKFKLVAGDFYSLLGHGLVLSVLKNDDIYRDRTIHGGEVKYFGKNFDLKTLGGIIKDETNIQEWLVAASELNLKYYKMNRIGIRFSFINDIDTMRKLGRRVTYSLNIKGDNIIKYFSYYTEIAFLDFLERSTDPGRAVYSSVTFNKSHISVLLEYKNYKNFDNELNNPPITDLEDEISTINDTEGGRIFLRYSMFEPDISFFINFGRYREYENKGNHLYGGISGQDIREKLSFTLSYGSRNIIFPVYKAFFNLTYQLSDYLSISISSKDKRYRDGSFRFNEQDHSIQLSYSPFISVYFLYQYSFNKIMMINNFFSGGISLHFKNNLELNLSGGNMRGGQVCSAGKCFFIPPFKGIKFSLLKIFN